jgi:predicted NUDIX family NTP pyrophosphohydrolase
MLLLTKPVGMEPCAIAACDGGSGRHAARLVRSPSPRYRDAQHDSPLRIVKRRSAGLLMYRVRDGNLEVLLIHPGGPFWSRKDAGAWSIPKGEFGDDEDALVAAKREFVEETGFALGETFAALEPIRQSGGKLVHAWAFEGDCDPARIVSNTFEIEYPPKSGRVQTFPEADKAAWFDLAEARRRINPAQVPFLDELAGALQRAGALPPEGTASAG